MMNYTNQLILDALYRLRADCNDPIIDESLQVICTAVHQWEYQDLFSHLKIQKICISEETIQMVIPLLENRLAKDTKTILDLINHEKKEKRNTEPLLHLVSFIKIMMEETHRNVKMTQMQWTLQDDEMRIIMKRYFKSIQLLKRIVSKEKINQEIMYCKTAMDCLQTHCEALQCKVHRVTYQVLKETYTPKEIIILTEIQDDVHGRIVSEKQRQQKFKEEIQGYHGASTEYHSLVQEYSTILQQIQQRKEWIAALQTNQ